MTSVYNYAKALFNAAKQEDALDEVLYDYETFVAALKNKQTDAWLDLVDSPVLTRKQKKDLIFGITNLHPVFVNFLKMLMKDYQIRSYEEIYEEFLILARQEQQVAHVRVIVAKPLTSEQLKYLRKELHGWFDDLDIEIEVIIDKRLLGGIRVMYQGQTIDRSFYSELQELKANLY